MGNPNYRSPTGGLATSRFDFEDHIEGTAFRHNSNQIDVDPSVLIQGTPYTTVADALAAISAYVSIASTNGQGFITVGDGYDTYHASNASILDPPPNANFPYDSTIPSIDTLLNDVLNNPNNSLNDRIRDGGIVLIKAGTYKISSTVDVPPGIIIMGEGFGTKIVNAMSSPSPLFRIKADSSKNFGTATIDPGSDSTSKFMVTRETVFFNLVIADNFVEPKFLGDTSYKLPINTTINNPLVSVEEGSNFTCDKVRFLGRVTRSGSAVTAATCYPIQTDGYAPSITGTIVTVKDSFIDGFSLATHMTSLGGVNDFFTFTNNFVRVFGYLSGDSASQANNCFFRLTGCNINIQDNHCVGEVVTLTSLAFIYAFIASPPVFQSFSKALVANNNIAVDRTSSVANTTFKFISFDPSIVATVFSYILPSSYGNNFQGTLEWRIGGDFSTNPQILLLFNNLRLNTPIAFYSTANIGQVTQDVTTAGAGTNMVIGAQGSTISTGGSLQLQSGTGSTSTNDGSVLISGAIAGDSSRLEPLRFGYISIALASTSTTLTASQYCFQTVKFTGALSANSTVDFPNVAGYAKLIHNATSNNFTLTVRAGGVGVIIPQGSRQWVYCNGAGLISGNPPNQIIRVSHYDTGSATYGTTLNSTSGASGFQNSSILITLTEAQSGDKLLINGTIAVKADPTAVGDYIVTVVDGASVTTNLPETEFKTTATGTLLMMPISTSYSLTATGTCTVRIRFATSVPGVADVYTLNPSSLVVSLVR